MRALSLWQPWADLVVRGVKRVENRPWRVVRHLRGPMLIHASASYKSSFEWEAVAKHLGVELPAPEALPRGGIVGVVTVVDCVTSSDDPWFLGPYGFVLEGARPLPFVPCKGRQRFFYPPDDVIERLRAGGFSP